MNYNPFEPQPLEVEIDNYVTGNGIDEMDCTNPNPMITDTVRFDDGSTDLGTTDNCRSRLECQFLETIISTLSIDYTFDNVVAYLTKFSSSPQVIIFKKMEFYYLLSLIFCSSCYLKLEFTFLFLFILF